MKAAAAVGGVGREGVSEVLRKMAGGLNLGEFAWFVDEDVGLAGSLHVYIPQKLGWLKSTSCDPRSTGGIVSFLCLLLVGEQVGCLGSWVRVGVYVYPDDVACGW